MGETPKNRIIYARDRLGVLRLLMKLQMRGRRKAVAFDVAPGERQFFYSVLQKLMECRAEIDIYMFYRYAGPTIAPIAVPGLEHRIWHVEHTDETIDLYSRLDLYITTEQFIPGPRGVFTLTLFHGQPAKGVTFKLMEHDPLNANDALFLYGPLQRQALDEYLGMSHRELPQHLSLYNIGYTKSDRLLNGAFDRASVLSRLGLDADKPTIVYAPAFNEGASMREYAHEIIPLLARSGDYNVITKLAVDCLSPELVGGVNWYEIVQKLEEDFPNFVLFKDLEIDPALAAADVLITCVSSVGFEFLALRKPVIFVHTPNFFRDFVSRHFPDQDVSTWASRTTVNGGRDFGITVETPNELPSAVQEVLAHPDLYPRRKADLPDYLIYNPGRATEAAVEQICKLLDEGVRSKRPAEPASMLRRFAPLFSRSTH